MILNENQVSVLVANLGEDKANTIVKALELQNGDEEKMKYKVAITYVSGLMLGWASALEKSTVDEFGKVDVETFRVIQDLKDQSHRYAEMVGLKRK